MTLIYWILFVCGVVDFFWWVPLIELVIFIVSSSVNRGSLCSSFVTVISFIALCVGIFFILKFTAGLCISNWWAFAAFPGLLLMLALPGGCTIFNLVMSNAGLMLLPTWLLVVGIVVDAITLFWLIAWIVSAIREKREQ